METSAVESTENKAANENQTAETQEGSSLEAAVQESKDSIQTAEPVKKRGRQKMPRDSEGNIIREAAPVSKKGQNKEAVAAPALPPTYLKPVINFPFKAMALKTQFPPWELTDKEQEENAILLEKCMARYLPQLQSEHAELVGLSIGLGMAVVSRYMAYRAYLESRAPQDAIQTNQGGETIIPVAKVDNSKKSAKNKTNVNPDVIPNAPLTGFLDGDHSRSPQI